jgi:hypothetical protein
VTGSQLAQRHVEETRALVKALGGDETTISCRVEQSAYPTKAVASVAGGV